MGTFTQGIELVAPDGTRSESVEALVDSGATYSWVPASVLRGLGISPSFRRPFVWADGREVERDMGEARVRLNGDELTTLVIFGDEDTRPLLGAYTIEGFGLAIDPVNQRLVRTPGLLM